MSDPSDALVITPRTSALILLARREAEVRGHEAPNWDHLCHAILWEGHGVAASVLTALSLNEPLAKAVEASLAGGSNPPPLETVLTRACEEARERGQAYVGTEHLLLALVDEDGPARPILGHFDAFKDAVQMLEQSMT